MEKFDPENFNFTLVTPTLPGNVIQTDVDMWETFPIPNKIIGSYRILCDNREGIYEIFELVLRNTKEEPITLYYGKIPNNNFGYQLLCNLELDLPIVNRKLNLDGLIED